MRSSKGMVKKKKKEKRCNKARRMSSKPSIMYKSLDCKFEEEFGMTGKA